MFPSLPLKDSELSGSDILLFGPAESRNILRARMTQFAEPEPEDHECYSQVRTCAVASAERTSRDREGGKGACLLQKSQPTAVVVNLWSPQARGMHVVDSDVTDLKKNKTKKNFSRT